ncbi:MAG: septum formation initiator family protein [Bacilli bacterium]|nr:septum formation initiator family protein [Bacilli bacterium]
MKKKKMSKSSKRSLLFFGTISLVVIGYFLFNIFSYTYNIYILKSEEKNLQEQLNNLEHNEKILKTEIEKLKDPDYIARYARENYQYSKDGEIILELAEKEEQNKEENKTNFDYELIIKLGIITIFFIILYVFIKSHKIKTKK